jgi:sarcosine oxidase
MRQGAELHGHEAVKAWQPDGSGFRVEADRGRYFAERLVFCGGAWSEPLLRDANVPLRVTRQTMGWFWPRQPEMFAYSRFPCWALDLEERSRFRGVHYGFPMMPDNPGFKIALHWPGEECDPDRVDRTPRPGDEVDLREALGRHFPGVGENAPLLSLRVCLYTNTSDSHFILDLHPRHERVSIACGFSGHGFKFASVVGEAMADLAMHGKTALPIGFLGLRRFGE